MLVKYTSSKTAVIHIGPTVVFNFLCKVFLEVLKVSLQCKVALSVAHDPQLPSPSLATQPQRRTLGNEPKQGFIICSPRRQALQLLPSWVCHHHLDWHRPNGNIGACHSARLSKCMGTRSHNSLASSRLLIYSIMDHPWCIDPMPSIKSSPSLELPLLPCLGRPNAELWQGSQHDLNNSKYIMLTWLFNQACFPQICAPQKPSCVIVDCSVSN